MSALAITSVTVQELHALHEQMTQPDPKTGKRLDPGVAVFFAVALVLDQRLEEICKALKAMSPVMLELHSPSQPKPPTPKSRKR